MVVVPHSNHALVGSPNVFTWPLSVAKVEPIPVAGRTAGRAMAWWEGQGMTIGFICLSIAATAPAYVFTGSFLKVISPPLHHLPSLREILSMIVGGAYFVALAVSELALDHVRRKPVFV